MSSARQLSFQPRTNLRRTLTYRPIIKFPYYGGIILQVLCALFLASDIAMKIRQGESLSSAFDWAPWFALLGWIGLNQYMVKPLMETIVHVHNTGITLERGHKRIEIPFANMSRLTLPNDLIAKALIPGFFSVKMASGEKFYFTIALERSEYVLETIASNRPDIVNLERLSQLRVQALVMDHGWARQKDQFVKAPLQVVAKYFAVPLLQTAAVLIFYRQHQDVNPYFLSTWLYFTVAALGIGLPIYAIKAIVVAGKERRTLLLHPNAVIRDMKYERKMNWISALVFWSLTASYFAYFVTFKVL